MSLSSSVAFTRSTLAVDCNSRPLLWVCSCTAENLSGFRRFQWGEGQRVESSRVPDGVKMCIALRTLLGQDSFVGGKTSTRAVGGFRVFFHLQENLSSPVKRGGIKYSVFGLSRDERDQDD